MSLDKRVWGGLLAVVGATAGLAAFVYFIGAATLWLALRNTGYSPDAAIEHQSKSQIIGSGLRGLLFIAGIALVLALVPIGRGMWRRRALRRSTGIARPNTPCRGLRAGATVLAFLLLLSASAVSWRWLTLAIAACAVLILAVLAFRPWHVVAILLAAVLAALSWQYGGPVNVRSAEVKPRSAQPLEGVRSQPQSCLLRDGTTATSWSARVNGDEVWITERNPCALTPMMGRAAIGDHFRRRCPVPYFGQSNDLVYLGAIKDVWQPGEGECRWNAGPIVERKRERVSLRFLRGEVFLNPESKRRTPLRATWETVTSFVEDVD